MAQQFWGRGDMPFVGRAACRRWQCEPDTLVVDPRHWVSPGSLQLNSLGKENVPFVGRGHAPAAHVSLPLHPPTSTVPKPSPLGGRWPGEAGSDEGCSVNITTSGKKSTFSPLISQKSKIFDSFPPGGSLLTGPGRYPAVDGQKKPSPEGEGGPASPGRMRGAALDVVHGEKSPLRHG